VCSLISINKGLNFVVQPHPAWKISPF
jgi:hypothetical protein